MKTLEEIMESPVEKSFEENVFFPEKDKESDSGECYYYYKCGSEIRKGCSS